MINSTLNLDTGLYNMKTQTRVLRIVCKVEQNLVVPLTPQPDTDKNISFTLTVQPRKSYMKVTSLFCKNFSIYTQVNFGKGVSEKEKMPLVFPQE